MTKKTKKKDEVKYPSLFKKQVLAAVEHYISLFRLNHTGSVLYMEEDHASGGYSSHAEADIDERYLKTDYKIYPEMLKIWRGKKSPKERWRFVDEVISHEVSHVVTEPLYNLIHQTYRSKGETERTREQLTEIISRVANKTWQRRFTKEKSK